MNNIIKIAYRNTTRQKKRIFLLGGAVAFGILIITLLNAFTAGLADNMKENFSQIFGGHVFISGTMLTDSGKIVSIIDDDETVQAAVDKISDKVETVNKRSTTFAELIFGSKQTTQRIDGIDYSLEPQMLDNLKVVGGSLDDVSEPNSLILPVTTANRIGVQPGETILAKLTTVTGQQNVGEFRVIATIQDQISFSISNIASAYANMSYLNQLLDISRAQYQLFHIRLKNMESMDDVADVIYKELAKRAPVESRSDQSSGEEDSDERSGQGIARIFGFNSSKLEDGVKPWKGTKFAVTTLNDVMEPIMAAVGILNTVGLVIFVIVLVITMVGIMNTFRMVMIERTKEIGTMRAFGMQRKGVRNIFLLEALFIAVGGAVCGLILSGIIMLIVGSISFSSNPVLQFFTHDGRFSFSIIPLNMILNLIILCFMTLFAAYLPARSASRLEPAKAFSTQY